MESSQPLHPIAKKTLRHPAGKEGDYCDADEKETGGGAVYIGEPDFKQCPYPKPLIVECHLYAGGIFSF